MKTLHNNVLIYDAECPLCNAYSGAFIQSGMLPKDGRIPYVELPDQLKKLIDLDKSRNEIALIDTQKGSVVYGVESLLTILGNNLPYFKRIFQFPLLNWLARQLYFLVSYNRKVIVPSKNKQAAASCTPDYNSAYRILFILLGSGFVAWTLHAFSSALPNGLVYPFSLSQEWGLFILQLLFQGGMVAFVQPKTVLEYMGQNTVVSLIGALLLLPAIWFSHLLIDISLYLYFGYFACTVLFIAWQHIKRINQLQLPWLVTATWILYRIFLLVLILTIQ